MVVDTNVAMVANDATAAEPVWDAGCVLACIAEIRSIVAGRRRLVLDDLGLIAAEYFRRLDLRGMPGVGDQFAKWVHDTQWDSSRCDRVVIAVDGEGFEEFPTDPALAGFDPADRKFIAVACAHPDDPEVLQAVDSKWWAARSDLEGAVAGSGGVTRADKILSPHDLSELLAGPVIVEEKVDGSNLGFSFDGHELRVEHRGEVLDPGTDRLYPRLGSWISEHGPTLLALLGARLTLFGEWCSARHTIRYDRLPDWLLAFDVYDRRDGRFLSIEDRDALFADSELATVPVLGRGRFTLSGLADLIGQSRLGPEQMEG